ncbi:hypothetical protein OSB04_016573 [Centaurea solstitialis]|uniref:Integrase catalytic domain-containing protein n=1 Tax=Centaurea solstitialis TaxID=347529 RepID=A0AA38T8W5_9ASTR|nr:hypothetical protein OSB04_016573 [Centaurea solstitialis]
MKDFGEAAYILGIKIYRNRSKRFIGLSQSTYIDKVLKRFKTDESKKGYIPMQHGIVLSKTQCLVSSQDHDRIKSIPYASAIGSIMYAMLCTRPDVTYSVSVTSRFQQNPGEPHWVAVKNIFKYLRRTKEMFLVFGGSEDEISVIGYSDANFQTDRDDFRSQSGYVFTLNGGVISWKSSKQDTIAYSTTEAEYIAASDATKEAIWLRIFISDLRVVASISRPIDILCDNSGAVAQAKEPKEHHKSGHVLRKYHLIREIIGRGDVRDKKHSILFNDTECIILSPEFKMIDDTMILLRTLRKDNVYCLDLEDVSSNSSLDCLFSKASLSESSLWHRRMCHLNFKNMNKLVKNNLVKGLPSKEFSCDDHCVACLKVIVDDYSRFTWVFFLRTMIKPFITRIENQTNLKVKIIRSDNGTEFKNVDLNCFCEVKSIERQFSAPRTPKQNGVTERRNRTLIEAARSLLADFNYLSLFRCLCTILNTKTHLGKFESKSDDGFLVGYSAQSKAFRVFNSSTRITEESDNVKCNENTPNILGSGPDWLFYIDSLTNSLNISSAVVTGTETEKDKEKEQIPTVQHQEVDHSVETLSVEQSKNTVVDGLDQSKSSTAQSKSPEENDSNLGVNLQEEPLHLTITQKNHPSTMVNRDISSPMITRKQSKASSVQNPQLGMLSCFLSQVEPKKAYNAMKDPS